jgi:hypothetical protein
MLAAFGPHPDLGKPRLWSHGSSDIAIKAMGWPLKKASEITEEQRVAPAEADNVIPIGRAAP